MKNRSTKAIQLLLITSVLASCNKPKEENSNTLKQQVYMRADSTAQYTNVTNQYNQQHHHGGGGNALLWYMAFRHLGGGMGYASNGLNSKSVVGTNTAKASKYATSSTRAGFGKTSSRSTFNVGS